MSNTFWRRQSSLLQAVRVAEYELSQIRKALEENPVPPRVAFKDKHGGTITEAKLKLGMTLARVMVRLDEFNTTMYTGRQGW